MSYLSTLVWFRLELTGKTDLSGFDWGCDTNVSTKYIRNNSIDNNLHLLGKLR
jgi:hypothetical protein